MTTWSRRQLWDIYASPKKKHMLSFNFLFGALCLRKLCYNKMLHLYILWYKYYLERASLNYKTIIKVEIIVTMLLTQATSETFLKKTTCCAVLEYGSEMTDILE